MFQALKYVTVSELVTFINEIDAWAVFCDNIIEDGLWDWFGKVIQILMFPSELITSLFQGVDALNLLHSS